MAKLIYSAITSLDGFHEDAEGRFNWSMPDEEVHQFVNDLERPTGTYLYGRRIYEVMLAWETIEPSPDEPLMRDYAEIWRSAEKVVYSTTLESPSSARTRIESEFDAESVRVLKKSATTDISIGGPELAGQALDAGLVDDIHLFISPVIVGGGKPALPYGVFRKLDLVSERGFGNGVVHVHYSTR